VKSMTRQNGSVDPARGHVVLASADSDAFTSLRRRSTSRRDRYRIGRELRHQVPRRSLGEWSADRGRSDPVQLIIESHEGRLEWLIPVRVGRMAASPYGFLRGAAIVMAEDSARLPSTGITPVICGDSHLGNFGFYASPEQNLVIDLNDFDEAHPGGWEWDLRRLTASIWVAGRLNGASEEQCESAVLRCVAGYRAEVRRLASTPLLARSYQRLDVERLRQSATGKSLQAEIARAAAQARRRTSDRALPKLTSQRDGEPRIVEDPPVVTRVSDADREELAAGLDDYLGTLAPHWRRALGGYTLIDIAHKVVGVGSVGLRAYVALLEGSSPDDVVFLQLKQARRSVLAQYVHGESAWHAHQGQRVVEYQQALQTVSDPLLGWTTVGPYQYYVRQFRNMKGSIAVESIDATALADYAAVVGHLLAKGHARTSGASMIVGYAGSSDRLDVALARFARLYADQTEADHAALVKAADRGILPIERGLLHPSKGAEGGGALLQVAQGPARDLGERLLVFRRRPARVGGAEGEDADLGGQARGGVVGSARAQGLGHGRGEAGPLEQLAFLQLAVGRDHRLPLRGQIVAVRGERDGGGLQGRGQAVGGARRGRSGTDRVGEQSGQHVLPAEQHLSLVREMPEERALGQSGAVRDLGHGRGVVPVLGEQSERGTLEAFARVRLPSAHGDILSDGTKSHHLIE
jgi:uncharacterized protein (DUF2252 family)